MITKEELNIYYQNLNGVKTKLNELNLNLSISNYDCIAFTETWLNNEYFDSEIFERKYTVYRKDRNLKQAGKMDGGGIALAIKQKFKTMRCDYLEDNVTESLWIKVYSSTNSYFFVGVVYFIVNAPKEHFKYFFNKLIENEHELMKGNIIILGDFNLKILSKFWLSNKTRSLPPLESFVLRNLNYFNLNQYNEILNINGYYLDYVLTNFPVCKTSEALSPLVKNDRHHPSLEVLIHVMFKCKVPRVVDEGHYNFLLADHNKMLHLLSIIDWYELYQLCDVDEAVTLFYEILYNIINVSVPKVKPKKCKWPAWFTQDIISKVKLKERLRKKFKRTSLGSDYLAFSKIRHDLKIDIQTAIKNFNYRKELSIREDPNEFWKFIKNKKSNSNSDQVLLNGDEILLNNEEKTQAFATYFQSVYASHPPHIDLANIKLLPVPEGIEEIKINYVKRNDIIEAFRKLRPKKSKGRDGIPQFFYKMYSDFFIEPLRYICNLAIKTKKFPTVWKNSIVCPIPKLPSAKQINQFRPISLLSTPSKILESFLYKEIIQCVKPIISEHQYGFLTKRSTLTNLVNFEEEIISSFDRRSQYDVVYTDFRKAFDLVPFDILLIKLRNYGFSSALIELFHSYLCGRSQTVLYNGSYSQTYTVNSSVPQGSNLGPLCFLLMINNLPESIKNSNCYLFADDFKICKEITRKEDCLLLEKDITRVVEWCKENKMELNIEKCFIVTYTIKHEAIINNYTLMDRPLQRKEEAKDLGVLFDTKLTFETHIARKVNEAYRMMGFIKRSSLYFRDTKTITLLFNTFVRSKLEYCSIIWNPYHKTKIDLIERIQKKFFKYLTRKFDKIDPTFIPYTALLKKYEADSLTARRTCADATYIYKVLNGQEDNPIFLSKLNFNVPQITTRKSHLFYQQKSRIDISKNSPINRMTTILNKNTELDPFKLNLNQFKKVVLTDIK